MIFPKYLDDNGTIGITACSAGVLKKIEKYEKSINTDCGCCGAYGVQQ
mgnify:CR=1 FL=1